MRESKITAANKNKLKRGLASIVEESEFDELIESGRKLRIKLGIDPTAELIHLGHLVLLLKLREFQEIGHEVCLIIGDFTATVGDPSGRTSARPKISEDDVRRNSKAILERCMRFLMKERTKVYFNSTWLASMRAREIFDLISRATVAQLATREDFRKRIEEGKPLFVHEFIYPFLQAYDSVVVKADIEIGGHDQLFNLVFARDIMRSLEVKPEVCITTPLLEGLDGKLKMSKTYGNYISVDERAEDIYGKLMGIHDELVIKYAELLCGFDEEDFQNLKKMHPFDAKTKVAHRITEIIKGKEEAERAEEWFKKVIRERETPDEIPQVEAEEGEILQKFLKKIGVLKSVSEAMRLTESGGIYVNGERIEDKFFELKKGDYIVRVGKTKFLKIVVR